MILSAGAGAFSMARIVETRGAYVGQGEELTAEAVAAKWGEITDTSKTLDAFTSGGQHGANMFSLVAEGKGKG
jgi:hypothetical protein